MIASRSRSTTLKFTFRFRNRNWREAQRHVRKIILLEKERERISAYGTSNLKTFEQGPAYVVFTSGSTGKPKGLVMNHPALLNLLEWQRESSQFAGDGRKTLQFASLSFDVSFQEMFSTWNVGGTLVQVSEELRRDVRGLWHLLIAEQIERLFITPVVLRHLALAAEKESVVPTSLREIVVAGEQLKITAPIRRMFERLPHCTLQNQYGPSESHVVTAYRLDGNPAKWVELSPIGHPISNVDVHILDNHLQPVDPGSLGEVHIGGVCLSEGYLNRPRLNEEKFIPNPFHEATEQASRTTSARLYKTGDLARRLADGSIEFLGRADDQIKIRGHRIEAGEVEAALLSHPNIREAIVTARLDARSERQLVGYVVPKSTGTSVDELRTFLARSLPSFMIPAVFIYLNSLPVTINGKVNRSALPDLSGERPKLQHIVALPDNEVESRLVDIWERCVSIRAVVVMDDFFELGGDSLLVVAMLIEIHETFGRNIPASTLLTHGTIRRFAEMLTSKSPDETSTVVAIQPLGTRAPLFLMPPIGGEVLGYRALASHLGLDQPLYGMRACGLDGKTKPFRNMEEMAAFHLEELLRIQPHEPFLIGGYSLGGTLAFEMAQQLQSRG